MRKPVRAGCLNLVLKTKKAERPREYIPVGLSSTSTASYLGSSSALIVNTLPSELLASSGIFLVPSAASKLPA